jgi:hypothetical protein
VDNIREVLGEDAIAKIFHDRHLCEKLLIDVPDGVYDHVSDRGLGWRMIIINKFTSHIMTQAWIEKGGPANLPDVISKPPFGTFPDIS